MTRLTPSDIAQMFHDATMPPDWRMVFSVAVVLAESGGYPLTFGTPGRRDENGIEWNYVDVGLFQINTYWHGDAINWSRVSFSDLLDPSKCIDYVLDLIKFGERRDTEAMYDWSLWNAWKNGTWIGHMSPSLDGVNILRTELGLDEL